MCSGSPAQLASAQMRWRITGVTEATSADGVTTALTRPKIISKYQINFNMAAVKDVSFVLRLHFGLFDQFETVVKFIVKNQIIYKFVD